MFTTDSLANNFSLPLFCLPKKLTWRVVYNLTGVAVAQEVPGSSCSRPCVSLSTPRPPPGRPPGRPRPGRAAPPAAAGAGGGGGGGGGGRGGGGGGGGGGGVDVKR